MTEEFKAKHPKLAKFIDEKAPQLKEVISKLPLPGVLGVVKNLIVGSNLPEDVKIEFNEKEAEFEKEITLAELEVVKVQLAQVNETMRAEAKGEHFLTYSWRPLVGYTFCAILINNYIVLPYLKKYGVVDIAIPEQVFMAILVILGAASAGRGFMQTVKAKK